MRVTRPVLHVLAEEEAARFAHRQRLEMARAVYQGGVERGREKDKERERARTASRARRAQKEAHVYEQLGLRPPLSAREDVPAPFAHAIWGARDDAGAVVVATAAAERRRRTQGRHTRPEAYLGLSPRVPQPREEASWGARRVPSARGERQRARETDRGKDRSTWKERWGGPRNLMFVRMDGTGGTGSTGGTRVEE